MIKIFPMNKYTVASADGGGGDLTKMLPMYDVLHNTGLASGDSKESLKKIIEASPLDKTTALDNIYGTFSSVDSCTAENIELFNNVNQILEKTNSDRLYLGPDAQEAINQVKKAEQDLYELQQQIDGFMKEDIDGTIEKYNSNLKSLKTDAKMKLLIMSADEINNAAKAGTSQYKHSGPKSVRLPYKPNSGESGDDTYVRYTNVEYHSNSENVNDVPYYTATETRFKYMKYWGWIKSVLGYKGWPINALDDDVDKLVGRFKSLGIPLPYSEALADDMSGYNAGESFDKPSSMISDSIMTKAAGIFAPAEEVVDSTTPDKGKNTDKGKNELPENTTKNEIDGTLVVNNYTYDTYGGQEQETVSMIIDPKTGNRLIVDQDGGATIYQVRNNGEGEFAYQDLLRTTIKISDYYEGYDPSNPESINQFINSAEARNMLYHTQDYKYVDSFSGFAQLRYENSTVGNETVPVVTYENGDDPFNSYMIENGGLDMDKDSY